MGQLRRNVVTGAWVVVAPERGDRPIEVRETDDLRPPRYSPGCPFCPGNEEKLAELLWELPADDGGWLTRVVSNRYPAFVRSSSQAGESPSHDGEDAAPQGPLPAVGRQEVLIETPRHDLDPSRLSGPALRAVVESCHGRYVHLAALPEIEQVFLFRNHGPEGGISLLHPHSQLVATAFTPPLIRDRRERLRRYHRETASCLICGIHHARQNGPDVESRIVGRDGGFVALVPWAAESPFEVWMIPLRHQADFSELTSDERGDFARLLGRVLRAYRERAGDPPYNFVVHGYGHDERGSPELHWFLRILPRGTQRAGFEVGSGIAINPSTPEHDARVLRGETEGHDR